MFAITSERLIVPSMETDNRRLIASAISLSVNTLEKNLSLRRECERIRSQFIVLRMAYSIIVAIDDNVYCLLVLLFDNFVEATLARRWLSSQYYAIG